MDKTVTTMVGGLDINLKSPVEQNELLYSSPDCGIKHICTEII